MSLIIGVLGRPKFCEREIMSFSKAIIDVIIKSNNIPLGIIPCAYDVNKPMSEESINNLHHVLDMCDGIILQGGKDYYQYDIEAIKYIDKMNIPVLGICLGMQSLGAAFGSSLTMVCDHNQPDVKYAHSVKITKPSKLYNILGKDQIMVNSRHNEMLINPMIVKPVAYSDNVIEAVEKDDRDFFIGVQWHPEDMLNYDEDSIKIFNALLSTCKIYHKMKGEI